MQDGHTTLAMEAALCLWEAMLEARDNAELGQAFFSWGAVHMRHAAIALAPVVLGVWDALSEDERERYVPYDWEFVPAVVAQIDWREDVLWAGPAAMNVDATVARIAGALKAEQVAA